MILDFQMSDSRPSLFSHASLFTLSTARFKPRQVSLRLQAIKFRGSLRSRLSANVARAESSQNDASSSKVPIKG